MLTSPDYFCQTGRSNCKDATYLCLANTLAASSRLLALTVQEIGNANDCAISLAIDHDIGMVKSNLRPATLNFEQPLKRPIPPFPPARPGRSPLRIPDAILTESPDVSTLLQQLSSALSPQVLMALPMVVPDGIGNFGAEPPTGPVDGDPVLPPVRPPRRPPSCGSAWGRPATVRAKARVRTSVKRILMVD